MRRTQVGCAFVLLIGLLVRCAAPSETSATAGGRAASPDAIQHPPSLKNHGEYGCPGIENTASVHSNELKAVFGLSEATAKKLAGALKQTPRIKRLEAWFDEEMTRACRGIVGDLTGSAELADGKDACVKAKAAIAASIHALGPTATLHRKEEPFVCFSPVRVMEDCLTDCAEGSIPSKGYSYTCGNPTCDGECRGNCVNRTGTPVRRSPEPLATNDAGCKTENGCTYSACDGIAGCEGVLDMVSVVRECRAGCAAELIPRSECPTPQLGIRIDGATNEGVANKLLATLRKNLGVLHKLSVGFADHVEYIEILSRITSESAKSLFVVAPDEVTMLRAKTCYDSQLDEGVEAVHRIVAMQKLSREVLASALSAPRR